MVNFTGHNSLNMKKHQYDTFICYSRRDEHIASIITEQLRASGISTFIVQNLMQTKDFERTVVDTINSCKVIIFLCTPNSLQSNWVKNEVTYAINIGKIVIPVIVDDTELPADICQKLNDVQYFNISTHSLIVDIQHIVSKIKQSFRPTPTWTKPEVEPSVLCDVYDGEVDGSSSGHMRRPSYAESPAAMVMPSDSKEYRKTSIWSIISRLIFVAIIIGTVFFAILMVGTPDKFDDIQSSEFDESQSIELPKTTPIDKLESPRQVKGVVAIAITLIVFVYIAARLRKYELKLYCMAEEDTESTLTVKVDDQLASSVKGKGMLKLRQRKGDYLITIESDNPEIICESIAFRFCRSNNGEVRQICLKKKPAATPKASAQRPSDTTFIRCFIAGSTRLVNERNATRAVLSILYNKWENYNLVISSYTFEDFSNSHTIGGQQIQYNDFIKDKADCAIFIVTENVGDKTLEEYRLAVETFNSNAKRPKIFVYANNLGDSEITKQFIEEVHKYNSYWREYSNIKDLMNLVKDDVDSELFNIFVFNKGLLK